MIVTVDDIEQRARRMTRALRVHRGQRVAVRAKASLDVVALHLAAAWTGVTLVPLNLRLQREQQEALAQQARVVAILDDDQLTGLVGEAEEGANAIAAAHETVLFTSGTTGSPKAARIGHDAMVASCKLACDVVGAGSEDVWLLCLPLFHIGGIAMMWRAILTRARLCIEPVVDAKTIAGRFCDGSVTQASVVPTTLADVLPHLTSVSRKLKAVLVGGGPVREQLLKDARAKGLPAVWTWGMTETCSQVATGSPKQQPFAAAPVFPGVEIRIVDDDGAAVAAGAEGVIEIKSPTMFRGYDSASYDSSCFFSTGDYGRVDVDGRLSILARRTDLIVSGGENLSPVMIEELLMQCDDVKDVGVAPAFDERWGQRPVAFVVLHPFCSLHDVTAFAREKLPRLWQPDAYFVVAELPRNALGKLDRRALQKLRS